MFAQKGSVAIGGAGARLLLALASGVAAWAVFPPARLPAAPLAALVALAPLLLAVRGAGPRRAFALGLVAGATMTGLGFAFLARAAVLHGGVSPLSAALLYAALSAYHGLFVGLPLALAAAVRRWVDPISAAPVLLVAAEVVLPAPLPWSFGAAFVDVGWLLPGAAVFGAAGLSLCAFVVAAAVAGGPRAPAALVTGAVALASMTWSSFLSKAVDAAPTVRVAALHLPAPAFEGAHVRTHARRPGATDDLLRRARAMAAAGAEIVVTPETALPGVWPAAETGELLPRAAGRPGTHLVAGAVVEDDGRWFNSAVVFDEAGASASRYDKRSLLPLAEAVPGSEALPALRSLSPRSGAFSAGAGSPAVQVGGVRVGVSICLEDTLPGSSRAATAEGAEILVNLTNDAWFAGSSEPEAHFALARMRAAEVARPLVRATAGGVTSIVDAAGVVTARVDPGREGEVAASVARLDIRSPRDRFGLLPLALLCAAALALGRRGRGVSQAS